MTKNEVLKIIDEVMNNREIDSIRNAILAIRDKVIDYPEHSPEHSEEFTESFYSEMLHCTIKCPNDVVALKLRGHTELHCTFPFFPEAKYVCIDTTEKIDTGEYGAYWYE